MRIIIIFHTLTKLPKIRQLHNHCRCSGSRIRPLVKDNVKTLASLLEGQKGTIEAVDASSSQVQRLMTLGLVEGAEVELAGSAIGGDPIELKMYGSGISLRREQARSFRVSSSDEVE